MAKKTKTRKSPDISRLFTADSRKLKAVVLLTSGMSAPQVGKAMGVTPRCVRYWRAQFNAVFLESNDAWFRIITRLVRKSLHTYEAYLDGRGEEVGGDLTAATQILKATGILSPDTEKVLNIDKSHHLTLQKTDIHVNAPEDDYFARHAPEQIQRIKRLLEGTPDSQGTSP
jgi:hypothetical protein